MRAYLLGGRPLYFPFLSGVLTYDCTSCDAPCCRGTPIGIGRSRELVVLGSAQPRLPLFATPGHAGSALLSIASPREACWFLDKNRRCRLERAMSRESKPAGCRLFPFHRFRAVGEALAVLPDFTCPIRIQSTPSEEGHASHDELVLEMHRTRVPPRGHTPLRAPEDLEWRRALKVERRILRTSASYLDATSYLPFAEKQQEKTAVVMGMDYKPEALAALDAQIRTFLGVDPKPSAFGTRDLVALTGVLRLMVSSLPRRDLPALLLALSILVDTYYEMKGAHPSPRTVISIFEQRLPMLYVLAHLNDRPMLKPGADPERLIKSFPAVRAPLLNVLEDVFDNSESTVARPLWTILHEQGDVFKAPHGFDEIAMLYGLGRILLEEGMFTPL